MNIKNEKFTAMLSKDVEFLQSKLNDLKFDCGKTDGFLGKKTFNALKKFQKNQDLDFNKMQNLSDLKKICLLFSNFGYSLSKDEKKVIKDMKNCELSETIENFGFIYDKNQDIYYSGIDPWQKKLGYCHLYDELSIHMGMVIDCEPIFFEYNNKKWMIELWKGQYDLSTGCEIGIYEKNEKINGYNFYNCVNDEFYLKMSFSLKKNNKEILFREGRHWWLTAFKPGEFSEPSQLKMDIEINFENMNFGNALVDVLKNIGYSSKNINLNKNNLKFTFDEPHQNQPISKTYKFQKYHQQKNKKLCETYEQIKKSLNLKTNDPCISVDKILKQYPEYRNNFVFIGKNNLFINFSNIIKNIL
ncbi:MAG: DUF4474 domain-containing protein [Clostridiales bacterium]